MAYPIIINITGSTNTGYTLSTDNITFYSGNTLNLNTGTYTLYVKDNATVYNFGNFTVVDLPVNTFYYGYVSHAY